MVIKISKKGCKLARKNKKRMKKNYGLFVWFITGAWTKASERECYYVVSTDNNIEDDANLEFIKGQARIR